MPELPPHMPQRVEFVSATYLLSAHKRLAGPLNPAVMHLMRTHCICFTCRKRESNTETSAGTEK